MHPRRTFLFALAAVAAASGPARAGHICEMVENGVLEVDADLAEWRDLAPLRRGHDSTDGSYELRCGFDEARLYLMVRVRDDRVIRTGKSSGATDDNLSVSLVGADGRAPWKLRFFPGTRGFKAKKEGGGRVRVVDTLLEDGWALEASVPLKQVPGWGPSTPLLLGETVYRDVDGTGGGGGVQATLAFRGPLHFSSHVPALRGFLAAVKLGVSQLRLDALVNMDGLPGSERVVSGGRFVGVLTDAFGFVELPVGSNADVLAVKLVDLDGDGTASILTHFRQRGGGGSREVVKVWSLGSGGQLEPTLAFETALELGKRRLVNRWALVPAGERRAPPPGAKRHGAGKRTGPGSDLVVEVADADNRGWDAASFAQVVPSPDVRPILTPWTGRHAVVYYIEGASVVEAEALPAPR